MYSCGQDVFELSLGLSHMELRQVIVLSLPSAQQQIEFLFLVESIHIAVSHAGGDGPDAWFEISRDYPNLEVHPDPLRQYIVGYHVSQIARIAFD